MLNGGLAVVAATVLLLAQEVGRLLQPAAGWTVAVGVTVLFTFGMVARMVKDSGMIDEELKTVAVGGGSVAGLVTIVYISVKKILGDLRDFHAERTADKSYDQAIAQLRAIIAQNDALIKMLQEEVARLKASSVAHIDARYRAERELTRLEAEIDVYKSVRKGLA